MWTGLVDRRKLKEGSPFVEGDPFATVLCLCDGPLCKHCGKNRILRPISSHYDEKDNSLWHMPYFGGLIPCDECKAKERSSVPPADDCDAASN
jgi:hypothetical protein